MILLNVPHPPAAATTLIVSLGLISRPAYLLVLEAAVGLLVGQAIIINRLDRCEIPVLGQPPVAEDRRAGAPRRAAAVHAVSLARLMARDLNGATELPISPSPFGGWLISISLGQCVEGKRGGTNGSEG